MPRPHQPKLDRDRIGATALALVDRTGNFTIPQLAAALHVQPSALYHHVSGRREIVSMLRAHMNREVDWTWEQAPTWEQQLLGFAEWYRRLFAQHPAAVRMLSAEPVTEPRVLDAYEVLVGVLSTAGVPLADCVPVLTALESFLLGSALDLLAPTRMIDGIDTERTPLLARALTEQLDDAARAERAFRIGLDTFIAGIRAHITTSS